MMSSKETNARQAMALEISIQVTESSLVGNFNLEEISWTFWGIRAVEARKKKI